MITADEFWMREFELASEPSAWALNAFGLKRAAEILWNAREEDVAVGVAAMLLTGYALENVIKALLLIKKPDLRRPGKAPRWPGGGHDLAKLFDEGGVTLGDFERQLLVQLRAFVIWRGRYPMPMRREDLKTEKALSWVTSPVPVVVTRRDREIAFALFDRVMSLLPF